MMKQIQAVLLLTIVAAHTALAAECLAPLLPTDLDLITSVEASSYREVHLHGQYRLGFEDGYSAASGMLEHNLTLRYADNQAFRVSVDPHDAMTMTLYLSELPSNKVVATSTHGGRAIERNLFFVLRADTKYVLSFVYTLAWREASASCPVIMMELAAQPESKMPKFTQCSDRKASPQLTKIVPVEDDKYYFRFQPKEPFYMPLQAQTKRQSSSGDDDSDDDSASSNNDAKGNVFTPIAHYPIYVPHIPGRHQQWKLRVDIQSRFLDGGDVAAFVTLSDSQKQVTPDECASGSSKCLYGTRALRNHFIVQNTLWAGEDGKDGRYVLWLVLRKPQPELKRDCAPYSISIELFPLAEQETFTTCEIDPLPPTFNAPGMYNEETGYMSFRQLVLVNLTSRTQDVKIKTSKPRSLLRVQLGNHKQLDIDLLLLSSSSSESSDDDGEGGDGGRSSDRVIIASSMGMSGPEGIVYELSNKKTYYLRISVPYPFREYAGQDQDFYDFCDSFELRAHVFPLTSDMKTDECRGTKPNLDGIQDQINQTKSFHFGLPSLKTYSFVHKIDMSETVTQSVVYSKRFFIPSAMATFILVESDRFGGTVHAVLRMDNSPEILYDTHRSVGASIHAVLQRGWYELQLLTPFVQMTTKSWADVSPSMPPCMRYNLVVRMQETDGCLTPLPLPEQFPVGVHNHHHYYDEFLVPSDGRHFMVIEPIKDSIFHLEVGDSAAPMTIKVVAGGVGDAVSGKAIATARDPFSVDLPELIVMLKGGKTYTVVFTFNLQAATSASECRTMELQMALSSLDEEKENKACSRYEQLKPEMEALVSQVPMEMDVTVAFKASDSHDSKTIYFELLEPAAFRFTFDYDFTRHGFDGVFCRCTGRKSCQTDACTFAASYRNSLEIPPTSLRPGNYSLAIKPWAYGLGADAASLDDVTLRCTEIQFHIAFAAVRSAAPKQAMCDPSIQYLPHTFNGVGMIWPGYKDEMHFMQYLRVSQQHLSDLATFVITKTSVLRAYLPRSEIPASVSVYSVDGAEGDDGDGGEASTPKIRASALGPNQGLYIELAPGTYQFSVQFYVPVSYADSSRCDAVPIEISIIKKDDVEKMTRFSDASGSRCEGPKFPTTPVFHGHDTLFRDPAVAFKKSIPFTVGERGAQFDFDVRYGFETGGLGVDITGIVLGANGEQQSVVVPMQRFPDRSFRSGYLQQGRYTLNVYDPVPEASYKRAAHPSCVAYSMHMRFEDYGNFSGTGGSSGHSTSKPTETPKDPESLPCPGNHYDTLPASSPVDSTRYKISGSAFRIPFDTGVTLTKQVHGREVKYGMAVSSVHLGVPVGSYVRVWVRSMLSKTLMQVQLSAGNDTVEEGQFFGWHTQTLVHRVEEAAHSNLRLGVFFFYMAPPKFGEDYKSCDVKKQLESYELYVTVMPRSDVAVQTKCPEDFNAEKSKRLPTASVTVNRAFSVSSDFNFIQSDFPQPVAEGSGTSTSTTPATGSDAEDDDFGSRRAFSVLQQAGQSSGSAGGGSRRNPFATVPVASHSIVIEVPQGASGVAINAHMRYNIAVSNMRLSLRSTNQTTPLVEQSGGPLSTVSGVYSAESLISVANLGPGKYTLRVVASNAEPRTAGSIYCVPFHLRLDVTAARYPGGIAPPPAPPSTSKPRVASFFPGTTRDMNVADSLQIRFTLDTKARPRIAATRFARLVSGADEVPASTEYFEDETTLVAVWVANSLKWRYSYTLKVDGSAIHTASSDNSVFASELPNGATYTMGHCGCSDGACVPGGACTCAIGNDFCSRCPTGYKPSDTAVPLGPAGKTAAYTVCVVDKATPAPPRIPNAPPSRTPQPGSPPRPPRTPRPAPPGDDQSFYPPAVPLTPAPPRDDVGNSDPTSPSSPDDGSNGDKNGTSTRAGGPFRTLRYVVSYTAMAVLLVYAAVMLVQHRQKATRTLRNPFRRVDTSDVAMEDHKPRGGSGSNGSGGSSSGGGASMKRTAAGSPAMPTTSAFDDDDEEEFGDENRAIVISS